MGRNKVSIFVYIIVGLAVVGLVSSLANNPGKFLISILITVAIAYAIFMIVTRVMQNQQAGANDEMKKYRKAAKRSNQKYNKTQERTKKTTTRSSSTFSSRKKRKHAPHLTVIEGKKSTKDNKDRASN